MISDLHLLRPLWLLCLLPLAGLGLLLWRQTPRLGAWSNICDSHLLTHLLQSQDQSTSKKPLLNLIFSAALMIIANAGPTWQELPTPTYKPTTPRVLLLDLSDAMLKTDLSPDRLSRAKFKLYDLLAHKGVGQFALIAFTSEPFVVSPLTDDGQTISVLLSSLAPEMMPVSGQNLSNALAEAQKLLRSAGYQHGQILVFTANAPSKEALKEALHLARQGIHTSIMPMTAETDLNPLYQTFARSGKGQLLIYQPDSNNFDQWLNQSTQEEKIVFDNKDDIPLWSDEGRWFLIPALVLLLPVFRRGWLQRIGV